MSVNYFPIFSTTIEKQKKKEYSFGQPFWPIPRLEQAKRFHKQDVMDTMTVIYGDEWRSYACCKYLLEQRQDGDNKNMVWTEKYRPTKVEGLLGSTENHEYLRDWLEQLKIKPINATEKKKKRQKDELYNLMILVGDHGSGKSASVITAAKETEYAISEMNPSSRRQGKDVMDTLGGMTESHLVRFDAHTQKRKFEGEKIVIRDTVVKKKKTTFDMMQHFKQLTTEEPPKKKEMHSFFEKTKEKIKKFENEKKIKNQPKQSLILLEEVDLLYEEDKGFWSAVYELNKKSKRPILVTCNDEALIPIDNLYYQDIIYYNLPEKQVLACYVQLICLLENHFIEPIDISYICSYFDYDTRKILVNLQFWLNQDDHVYSSHLFARIMGFYELIQQPTSLFELMDRLQGLDTKKQDLCKQYYFNVVGDEEEQEIEIDTVCNLMENASFADAYIDLTEKQRHQIYDIDQYDKQDAFNNDLKMIHKEPGDFDHWYKTKSIQDSIMISNTRPILASNTWCNPMLIRASHWESLCYERECYFNKTWDIVYSNLLGLELNKRLVMMEYLPEIRNMCKYDQGIAGNGRHRRTRKRIRYIQLDNGSKEFIDWKRKT